MDLQYFGFEKYKGTEEDQDDPIMIKVLLQLAEKGTNVAPFMLYVLVNRKGSATLNGTHYIK